MDLQFEHTVILAVDGYYVPIEVKLRYAEEGHCEEVFEACLYPCVERDEDEAVVGEVQCSVLANQMLRLWAREVGEREGHERALKDRQEYQRTSHIHTKPAPLPLPLSETALRRQRNKHPATRHHWPPWIPSVRILH